MAPQTDEARTERFSSKKIVYIEKVPVERSYHD
jgi:hypothetical protein